jgi:hypothetical protein
MDKSANEPVFGVATGVDPELRAIHLSILNLYNRETQAIKSQPTSRSSVNVVNFLAGQAIMFADSTLILLEDSRQPINVPAASVRTCLEAQARANYIIAVKGKERERLAAELELLMKIGHEYYELMGIKMAKEWSPNPSNMQPRDLPYLPHIQNLFKSTDTTKVPALEKQYKELSRKWGYTKIVGRDKFLDKAWMRRSEAQQLQPELYLRYTWMCSFVHCDPTSIRLTPILTPLSVAYTTVMAEITAVLCFFIALGKERDPDFVSVKKQFIAFDVCGKILPREILPPVAQNVSTIPIR